MIIEAAVAFWQRVIDGNPSDAMQMYSRSAAEGAVIAFGEALTGQGDAVVLRSRPEEEN